ncbi:MAG: hypothetical protein WDM85_15505 [Caulobacteraceae bacterium]
MENQAQQVVVAERRGVLVDRRRALLRFDLGLDGELFLARAVGDPTAELIQRAAAPTAISQARGLSGSAVFQATAAAANASCRPSSARSKSPTSRIRVASASAPWRRKASSMPKLADIADAIRS